MQSSMCGRVRGRSKGFGPLSRRRFDGYGLAMSGSKPRNGLVMMIAGALMLLASLLYLLLVDDPFPMWLIISGVGVMFIGVGSATKNQHPGGTTR